MGLGGALAHTSGCIQTRVCAAAAAYCPLSAAKRTTEPHTRVRRVHTSCRGLGIVASGKGFQSQRATMRARLLRRCPWTSRRPPEATAQFDLGQSLRLRGSAWRALALPHRQHCPPSLKSASHNDRGQRSWGKRFKCWSVGMCVVRVSGEVEAEGAWAALRSSKFLPGSVSTHLATSIAFSLTLFHPILLLSLPVPFPNPFFLPCPPTVTPGWQLSSGGCNQMAQCV